MVDFLMRLLTPSLQAHFAFTGEDLPRMSLVAERLNVPTDTEPTFNLKAVLKETELKADTLRAWERRYGLPKPLRSRGRHRLYSERDVQAVKWLMARQAEGFSISRAVELWRHLETQGQDPLLNQDYALPRPPDPAFGLARGEALHDLRQTWLRACLTFDESAAEAALNQAFALYPVETVCAEILMSGLSDLGEAWYCDDVTVQQEHFTSALAVRRLEALLTAAPPPSRTGRILVACPPEETHVFPLLLISVMLRRRGWDVVYLGENVPLRRLDSTLSLVDPNLVILVAQTLHTAAKLLETSQLLFEAGKALAFGGRVFNSIGSLREKIPGAFLGEKLPEATSVIEDLLRKPPKVESRPTVSKADQKALVQFRQDRSQVEAEVLISTRKLPAPTASVLEANRHMGNDIIAALLFGDISLLGYDLAWVEGLLSRRGQKAGILSSYLHAYLKATQQRMGDAGKPIIDWLGCVLSQDRETARNG